VDAECSAFDEGGEYDIVISANDPSRKGENPSPSDSSDAELEDLSNDNALMGGSERRD